MKNYKLNKFYYENFKDFFSNSIGSRFKEKVDQAIYIKEAAAMKAATTA